MNTIFVQAKAKDVDMRVPKYTDTARYPNGYRKSTNTDVAATFRRIRTEQQRIAEEAKAKVAQIKRAK